MSEKDRQETLLAGIEELKAHYKRRQNPCIALLISRYYRLLADLDKSGNKRENYDRCSKIWLSCRLNAANQQQMQYLSNEFIWSYAFNL